MASTCSSPDTMQSSTSGSGLRRGEDQMRLIDGVSNNSPKRFRPERLANALGALDSRPREPELTLMEKQYLLACERGDLATMKRFLVQSMKGCANLNMNCVDPLGRTALRIAIENENIEMIDALLEANAEMGDSLLHAINEENVEAVELILNHLEKQEKFSSENQGVVINENSTFTPDITPIILSAHRDNYEIIKLLLDRGASIAHPHDVRCACKDCLQASAEDSLRLSRSRINAYRALASPSLICLSTRDPILYAFELSWELRRLSNIENEFKNEYQELSQKCQTFAVNLLDQTRGSKELEILLNHDNSDRWPVRERAPGERMQLTRLKLAIQFRQKRFVAHPNCQQVLASIWYEGLPGFRRRHVVFRALLALGVSFGFPFLSLIYLVAPKSSIGQFVRKPFIKFLCHSASYFTFLFLLILASQRINYDSLFSSVTVSRNASEEDPDRKERRGPPPTPVEWAIMAWIAGLIWVEVKQLWDIGLYEYSHNMWNILDFITNSLYIATITLRLVAYILVESEISKPDQRHLGRHIRRQLWDAWDPTLISECVFATANIFSSLKLVHIFTVNPHLGPLQISIGRMVIDILKFFFVYWLVLFSFACGLNQLFWYYSTMRSNECQDLKAGKTFNSITNKTIAEDICEKKYSSFANLYRSLETLFWAGFNLVELDTLDLYPDHYFTEWTGKTMFGAYNVIALVVLLNMLIGMMSTSYAFITCVIRERRRTLCMHANSNKQSLLIRPETFFSLFNSLETLFWSIFGLIDLDRFTLKESHTITEWAGKTMFGSYGVISLVVLLNMLIAMMSNSFQYIANQADVEWKFARSKLWIEYFEESGTLPPPFNIIPSPKTIYYVFRWIFEKMCRSCTHPVVKQQRSLRLQKILKAVSQKEANYAFVMRSLVKRYVAFVQRIKQQSEGVSEDDVNEIKQDISAFRYELLEILRNAGYETGDTSTGQKTPMKNKRRSAQAERRLMKGFQLNVDTIPEIEHAVAKTSLSGSLSGGVDATGLSSGNGKPKTSVVATKIAKFRKLSRKIPLAKRITDLSGSSDKSSTTRTRAPKFSENKQRASSVELEQFPGDVNPFSGVTSTAYHQQRRRQSAAVPWRSNSQPEQSLTYDDAATAAVAQQQHRRVPTAPTAMTATSSALSIPKRDSFLWRTVSSDSQDEAGSVLTRHSGSLDVEAQPDDALL